jgi:hypothetical protein
MTLPSAVVLIGVNVLRDISNSAGFPWAECSITETRVMYVADTIGLSRTKRDTGKHRYDFELVTNDMLLTQGRGVMAKLSKATNEILSFKHPRLSYSQGTVPLSGIQISGGQDADTDIVIMESSDPWQLLAGDYIQMPNDSKVYQVVEDTLLTTGPQSVELVFPIRKNVFDGTHVIANDVTWFLISDGIIDTSMQASENQDMQIVLTAVEHI